MNIDVAKYSDGLVPAIIQDSRTGRVLMLGFMNAAALDQTRSSGRVTFFSRSKQRLWTKGETSGNFLDIDEILTDCDEDTILIKAVPAGPACHTGTDTCFGEENTPDVLRELEAIITARKVEPAEGSYTSKLFTKGINRIAQKLGEEAVEVVIAAKDDDTTALKGEVADLLFHLLVLLREKDIDLEEVMNVLCERRR